MNSISTLSVFEISFYQNLFSVPIVLILVLFTEPENIQTKPRTRLEVFSFVFFCMLGMGTRFFSVDVRKQNTVASVMVLGNLCKLSTIFINFFFWERHGSEWGTTSVAVGLVLNIVFFYRIEVLPFFWLVFLKSTLRLVQNWYKFLSISI